MICPQFYPLVGGYERSAERLSEALVARGHNVSVFTERRFRQWPRMEIRNGVQIRRWWCIYKRHLHLFTSLAGFTWVMLSEGSKCDVIHVHQYGFFAAASVILARIFRKPILLKLTNTGPMGIRTSLASNPLSFLLAPLHRNVDLCIATTKDCYEEAAQFGIDRKCIRLIGNGVDTDYFVPGRPEQKNKIKKELGLDYELVVLFTGRIAPEKNPLGLINAWKMVIEKVPSAMLAIVGDGPLLEAVKVTVESLNLGSSIIIVGHSHDVLQWYQAADIFVIPSINEGLSNSLLEALSCGLPVVSTRVSGAVDVIAEGHAGKIVNVGDMQGFASAISELIENEGYRKTCGKSGRRFVIANYSQVIITEAVESLYYSVCRKPI